MSIISKKPKKSTVLSEKDVDALISKGGDVPIRKGTIQKEKQKTKKIPVQLRLSQDLLDTIDGLIDKRIVKISRHAWFLEAIAKKIKNEQV